MKRPRAKLIVCLALAFALLAGMSLMFIGMNSIVGERSNAIEVSSKLEGIGMSLVNLVETGQRVIEDYMQQERNSVNLTALSLRGVVAREGDAAIRYYGDGCVVRKDADGLVLPEDASSIPVLEPQQIPDAPFLLAPITPFEGEIGGFWTYRQSQTGEAGSEDDDGVEYMLCVYRRIYGAYYYLGYTPVSAIWDYRTAHADIESAMLRLEENYDCRIVAFEDSTDVKWVIYYSDLFSEDYLYAQDMGIDPGAGLSFKETNIEGSDYLYAVSEPFAVSGLEETEGVASIRIVYLTPVKPVYSGFVGKGAMLTVVALVAFMVLIVWVFSVIGLMRRKVVSQSQRRRYGPARTRLMAALIGFIGLLAIVLTSMFSEALSNVYSQTRGNQGVLETLKTMLAENSAQQASADAQRTGLYVSYAERIAELLTAYPELKTAGTLAEMSQTIGSDYLMLYDDRGRETLSSARYTQLRYGTQEDSSTYDFRRLISGVPSIVHEPCVDEVTGLDRQLIGVSMDDDDISNGYASLIVALEPDRTSRLSGGDIMQLLTNPQSVLFSVDRESGTILQSSDPDLTGRNAIDLGLSEASLRDGFMGFFRVNGERWYACATEFEGALCYCASRADSMFGNMLSIELYIGVVFLVAYVLLAAVALFGYTDRNIETFGGRVVDDADWLAQHDVPIDLSDRGSVSGMIGRVRERLVNKSPERRAWLALQLQLGLGLLSLVSLFGRDRTGGMAIVSYVLYGRWEHGMNLFALTRIVILAVVAVLALLAIGLVFGLISSMMEAKGRTISRLLGDLLQYAVVIVALFYAFDALGFDTRALLASLGIFSLAISLGAKDLVADILSGVGIVFSGEYQIGDIVDIGGFKGRVWQIGVRSTMLVNSDGNIKNVSNRNVSNVTNLSRMNSWYTMQISVNYDQPLEQVEEMLMHELPRIGKGIEEIIQGPVYRGITAVGSGSVTLAFAAECREQDLSSVRSKLNMEILRIFERNNIPIR